MQRLSASSSRRWSPDNHGPELTIDGNIDTKVALMMTDGEKSWISVTVPASTRVGYVAVYNRIGPWAALLGPVEIWVGEPSAPYTHKCGELADTNVGNGMGPYTLNCDHVGSVVTVKQVEPKPYLTLGEIKIFAA